MDIIRLIHIQYWIPEESRFKSLAFTTGGGKERRYSLLSEHCIASAHRTVCEHAVCLKYVETQITHTPPLYWQFDRECHFPKEVKLVLDRSSGDDCHYVTEGLSGSRATSIGGKIPIGECKCCTETGVEPLTIEMANELKAAYDSELEKLESDSSQSGF